MIDEKFNMLLTKHKIKVYNKRSILMDHIPKLLNKTERPKFKKWICGQTGELLKHGLGVYTWDVRRFIELVREGKPTYFD